MSFVSKAFNKVGSIFSGGGDKAAVGAANTQARSGDEAIALQRESRDIARADLQKFRKAGEDQLDPLSKLISDPTAQLDFVQKNPFYTALADDAQNRLFSNQAAKGKVGSGGTAQALQNSLLLLGQDLLNNNINQRQNMVNTGTSAAAGQSNITQNSGNTISDLITGKGNALAAGQVGAANARAQGINSAVQTGTSIASLVLSDRRTKTAIQPIGRLLSGLPWYKFKYRWDKATEPFREGVMADEVEQIMPDAVITMRDGLQMVDYSKIGITHAPH